MPFDEKLAQRVRTYLAGTPSIHVAEKRMFGGLAFLVNGKMCVNVSSNRLMCRFDPRRASELSAKPGYAPMIMRGRQMEGYCYVDAAAIQTQKDFEFWLNACLGFNDAARASAKR